MSVASEIIAAVAFTGYPCAQGFYDNAADTYFTFNMDAVPDNFSDDEPNHDRWLIQLHLFAPFTLNTTTVARQVRNAIRDAGFTYPVQINASETVRAADGTEQHLVFEFEAVEAI